MKKHAPKVAVIGAGCSGLTAIKNLLQAGVKEVVCFEQNGHIGGNWAYTAEVSHSSVCETTHIISSKKMSEYVDFPMPDNYPDYPSHRQVLAYFESYTKHFNLEPFIRFNTQVKNIQKLKNEQWNIELASGEQEIFDYVLIANGHHSVPRHPAFKDDFTGEYMHSHSFKNNQGFEGKRVLVVGAGNSGCDCAVEISRKADFVAISIRTPQYILPKFFLGKPTDSFNEGTLFLPQFIKKTLDNLAIRLQLGKYEDYGLEKPQHSVTEAHPTINSELLYKIRHGKVHPRRHIQKIEGQKVFFTDGKAEEFDTLVAATGYHIATPFFDKSFLDYSDSERVPLYLRMFHPQHPSLIFIGLVQPQGAVWPLSDRQSKLAGNYIMERWKLPHNVAQLAEKDSDEIDQMFLKRKRHTIEVEYHLYARKIEKQIPTNAPIWNAQNVLAISQNLTPKP